MATQDSGEELLIEEVLTEQYFLELMMDVADDSKVERMAILLGVSETTFVALKREVRSDTPLLATKVLMAWRNNLTCDRVEEAKRQLATVFVNIGLARKGKQVISPIGSRSATPPSNQHTIIDLGVIDNPHLLVHNPAPPAAQHGQHLNQRKKCTAATCGWILCYSTLGVFVIVFLAAIPSVKYVPKTSNDITPPFTMANDTVELSFSLSAFWLHTLSLSIDKPCTGVAYTHHGKCSNLYSAARVCYQELQDDVQRVVYLLPGSSINFTIAAGSVCETNIWVIWNPDLLRIYNFSSYSCDDPPPQTKCLRPRFNPSEPTYLIFNVTEPAYYTYQYSPNPPFACDLTRYYNICSYNVTKLAEIAGAVSWEPIQSELVEIDILYKPYTFSEVCTLLHVVNDDYNCRQSDLGGTLHAEMSRRQDVVLFPGLLTGVSVLVLLAVIVTHISCKVRQKRRTIGPHYEPIGSTNE